MILTFFGFQGHDKQEQNHEKKYVIHNKIEVGEVTLSRKEMFMARGAFFTDNEKDVRLEVVVVEAEPIVDLVGVAGEPPIRNDGLDILTCLLVVQSGVERLLDVRRKAHREILVDLFDVLLMLRDILLERDVD